MFTFEFDEAKSQINLKKHKIDFFDAQTLWHDPNLLQIQTNSIDEPRWLVIGQISQKHWSAVITYRGNNIRLISVRRSRQSEIKLYES